MARLPFLASFLLERLGPADEALVGDLVEEYQTGRSRLWVWYQVVTAILLHTARTLRAHRRRSTAGILCGWLIMFVWEQMVARTIEGVSATVALPHAGWLLVVTVGTAVGHVIVGAVIGRIWRPIASPIVFGYLVSLLIPMTISALYFSLVFEGPSVGVPVGWWTLGQLSIACVAAMAGAVAASGSSGQQQRSVPSSLA